MPTPTISKVWSPLGSNYCFTTWDQLGKDIATHMLLTLSGDFTLITQGDTPGDTQYPWLNPADGRIYRYLNGGWYAEYPFPAAVSGTVAATIMWSGAEADIPDLGAGLDGTTSPLTDYSGPFWEKETDFNARMPLGPGTLAVSGAVVTVGSTGGVDRLTLTSNQIPEHQHTYETSIPDGNPNDYRFNQYDSGGGRSHKDPQIRSTEMNLSNGDPVDVISPYTAIWFIRRTTRKYLKYV